jgi:hypothetical protein
MPDDPVPRPIFAVPLPYRHVMIRTLPCDETISEIPVPRRIPLNWPTLDTPSDQVAAWNTAAIQVKCEIPDMETLSLRACNSMRKARPSPWCGGCLAWKKNGRVVPDTGDKRL